MNVLLCYCWAQIKLTNIIKEKSQIRCETNDRIPVWSVESQKRLWWQIDLYQIRKQGEKKIDQRLITRQYIDQEAICCKSSGYSKPCLGRKSRDLHLEFCDANFCHLGYNNCVDILGSEYLWICIQSVLSSWNGWGIFFGFHNWQEVRIPLMSTDNEGINQRNLKNLGWMWQTKNASALTTIITRERLRRAHTVLGHLS